MDTISERGLYVFYSFSLGNPDCGVHICIGDKTLNTTILAGIFTVVSALIAAATTLITVYLQRTMKAAIGTQNGLGSVMKQLERLDKYITDEYDKQAKVDQEMIVRIVLDRIAQEKE